MLHPVHQKDEGMQESTRSHGTDVMMITHDKLSYFIRSHPENGRKRNSTAASIQKSCLDNQHCSQWFPSRNTHSFAAAADSNSTWLFSHAKKKIKNLPLLDEWLCTICYPNYQRTSAFCISHIQWLWQQKNACSIGRIVCSNCKAPKQAASFTFFRQLPCQLANR